MSWYDQMYALVTEIDENTRRVREAAISARSRTVRQELPGGVGSVTVTGSGTLLAVQLDRYKVSTISGAALGSAVLRAITAAEAQAKSYYADATRAAHRDVGM